MPHTLKWIESGKSYHLLAYNWYYLNFRWIARTEDGIHTLISCGDTHDEICVICQLHLQASWWPFLIKFGRGTHPFQLPARLVVSSIMNKFAGIAVAAKASLLIVLWKHSYFERTSYMTAFLPFGQSFHTGFLLGLHALSSKANNTGGGSCISSNAAF